MWPTDGSVNLDNHVQSALSIGWLLRVFLTELPEPLLTAKFSSTFIKTQLNPDATTRYRNMRKLITHLPAVNRAVLRAVLELFRLVLHHRRKNKLVVSEFCSELGPVLLGMTKAAAGDPSSPTPTSPSSAGDAVGSADVLKTLITQYQYMMGMTDEPAEHESLPLYTKKSTKVLLTSNSRARGLLAKQRSHTPQTSHSNPSGLNALLPSLSASTVWNYNSPPNTQQDVPNASSSISPIPTIVPPPGTSGMVPSSSSCSVISNQSTEAEELISLTDGIMLRFLDLSIRSVLFEPQVRISFNYEAKIPNHLKRNYTIDRLSEVSKGSKVGDELRLGAWRPSLDDSDAPAGGIRRPGQLPHKKDGSVTARDELGFPVGDENIPGQTRPRRSTTTGRSAEDTAAAAVASSSTGGAAPGSSHSRKSGGSDEHTIGDGDSSNGSASSRRRSRRISINEVDQDVDLTRFEDGGSASDEGDRRKRHSIDPLETTHLVDQDAPFGSSSSDSEVDAKESNAVRKKKKRMERRSSTSKVTLGSKAKVDTTKKKNRRSRHSAEIALGDVDLAGEAAVQTPTAQTASPAPAPEKPRQKVPRSKSKVPTQPVLDSKTIMENAPSPPRELPPPLAASTT